MFTYFNPIMRRGSERFCQQIKEAGASGPPLALYPLGKSRGVSQPRDMRVRHCLHVAHPTLSQLPGPVCMPGLEGLHKAGCFLTLCQPQKDRPSLQVFWCLTSPWKRLGLSGRWPRQPGLELVLLTTPTTPTECMEAIAQVSQGFVYLVLRHRLRLCHRMTDTSEQPRAQDPRYRVLMQLSRSQAPHEPAAGTRVLCLREMTRRADTWQHNVQE